jgi:hypothetical protein
MTFNSLWDRDLFVCHCIQPRSGTTQSDTQPSTEGSYHIGKAAGCKTVAHFHVAEVKNVSNYKSTPPYILGVR